MKRTITIELDVAPGQEAAVAHMAGEAIIGMSKYAQAEINSADRAMALLQFAVGNNTSPEAQAVWDKLKAEAQRTFDAQRQINYVLSEIRFVMSEADRAWRMGQSAQPKEEA